MPVKVQDDKPPRQLELEDLPVHPRDRDIVTRLVRTYQTYAGSLSEDEQQEFLDMMQSGEYTRQKGRSAPAKIHDHHVYVQMHDQSNELWIRDKITFAKWALLATVYPLRSLIELAKVVTDLELERQPCFHKYTGKYSTTLESLELPEAWQLAKQCPAAVRISPSAGTERHTPTNVASTVPPSPDPDSMSLSSADKHASEKCDELIRLGQENLDLRGRLDNMKGLLSDMQEHINSLEVLHSYNFDDLQKVVEDLRNQVSASLRLIYQDHCEVMTEFASAIDALATSLQKRFGGEEWRGQGGGSAGSCGRGGPGNTD